MTPSEAVVAQHQRPRLPDNWGASLTRMFVRPVLKRREELPEAYAPNQAQLMRVLISIADKRQFLPPTLSDLAALCGWARDAEVVHRTLMALDNRAVISITSKQASGSNAGWRKITLPDGRMVRTENAPQDVLEDV